MYAFFQRIEKVCFFLCIKSMLYLLRITKSMLLDIRIAYVLPLLRITKSMIYFVRNLKYV